MNKKKETQTVMAVNKLLGLKIEELYEKYSHCLKCNGTTCSWGQMSETTKIALRHYDKQINQR
jgi:hypothetical protein